MAILRFHIVPNAKENKVVGEHGGAIKIKLRAPTVEGKANAALISFLAERLKVPARTIVLLRGEKSRDASEASPDGAPWQSAPNGAICTGRPPGDRSAIRGIHGFPMVADSFRDSVISEDSSMFRRRGDSRWCHM